MSKPDDTIQFPLSRSELQDIAWALEMHVDFLQSQIDDMQELVARIKAALEPSKTPPQSPTGGSKKGPKGKRTVNLMDALKRSQGTLQ
jgi:hypothetical protein